MLAVIEISLFWTPTRPWLLKFTTISAVSPTWTGVLGRCGTVHPQVALASEITRGASPVLIKRYLCETCVPSFTFPKS